MSSSKLQEEPKPSASDRKRELKLARQRRYMAGLKEARDRVRDASSDDGKINQMSQPTASAFT
jgi:hypothetical protein